MFEEWTVKLYVAGAAMTFSVSRRRNKMWATCTAKCEVAGVQRAESENEFERDKAEHQPDKCTS